VLGHAIVDKGIAVVERGAVDRLHRDEHRLGARLDRRAEGADLVREGKRGGQHAHP
jgi:hypothetical protein